MTWVKFLGGSSLITSIVYVALFIVYGNYISDQIITVKDVNLFPIVAKFFNPGYNFRSGASWVVAYQIAGIISVFAGYLASVIFFYWGTKSSARHKQELKMKYFGLLSTVLVISVGASWKAIFPATGVLVPMMFVAVAGPLVYMLIGSLLPSDVMK